MIRATTLNILQFTKKVVNKIERENLDKEVDEPNYNTYFQYWVIAHVGDYDGCDFIFRYFDKADEVEEYVKYLLTDKYRGFEETDIRVIHNSREIKFIVEKELIKSVRIVSYE